METPTGWRASWRGDLVAIVAGALLPFSLAPYNIWPLGILAPALLVFLLDTTPPKKAFWRSWFFGAGMFGAGTSWVYISIHDFGGTAAPLAVIMTAMFVLGLALVFAAPFYCYARYFSHTTLGRVLGFSAMWVLGEWLRSWFLTGFPWLYLGYGHVDTWLAGWAPVFGVFGLSLVSVLSGSLATEVLRQRRALGNYRMGKLTVALLGSIGALWVLGLGLSRLPISEQNVDTLSVAIVQPNIPLAQKWDPIYQDQIMQVLRDETDPLWHNDLVVWPEASIPLMYHDAGFFLEEIEDIATSTNTGVITGILYDDAKPMTFYNSIIGLGRADGIYFKQRLVPFGEYVPLERWLRGLINFFNLPNSIIFPGPKDQDILSFDNYKVAPSICYEIVYPDLVARLAKDANLLITISNDAWFGRSIGPLQHFQMAQMRALENRRTVLRGTNTGLSGIINSRGQAVQLSEQFARQSIQHAKVKLINQRTLFSYWGSAPIVCLCAMVLALLLGARLRTRQQQVVGLPD